MKKLVLFLFAVAFLTATMVSAPNEAQAQGDGCNGWQQQGTSGVYRRQCSYGGGGSYYACEETGVWYNGAIHTVVIDCPW